MYTRHYNEELFRVREKQRKVFTYWEQACEVEFPVPAGRDIQTLEM